MAGSHKSNINVRCGDTLDLGRLPKVACGLLKQDVAVQNENYSRTILLFHY